MEKKACLCVKICIIILVSISILSFCVAIFVRMINDDIVSIPINKGDEIEIYQKNKNITVIGVEHVSKISSSEIPKVLKEFYNIDWDNQAVKTIIRAVFLDCLRVKKKRFFCDYDIITKVAHNSLIIKKKEVRFLTEEAILSYKIAKKYSNDEILEFHLNKIYFGHGIFGFPAASDYYFKKDITQLQIHEIAFLISISMDYLHSYILEEEKTLLNPETAKINRDRILSYMARRGVITPAQAEESKVMPLSNAIEKIQTEL